MIDRAKLITTCSVIALVTLSSLPLTKSAAFAQTSDKAPTASSALPDNPATSSDSVAGTVSGQATAPASVQDNTVPAQDNQPQATQHKSVSEVASKVLYAISKHPDEKQDKTPPWKIEQNQAVEAARAGKYDNSLPTLKRLRSEHPQDLGIASDYAAILGWAGHDQDAVDAYKALPPGPRPDFLIDAIGHSYRNLHQPEDALAVYRLGEQTYPDNQSFVAGEILSLLEANHLDEAKQNALDADKKYANPTADLTLAIRTTLHADAVALGRAGQYKDSLAEFASLHEKYPSDETITGDYVAVLSWAGHDVEAVALYRTLTSQDQPDYILDAAAHSYRNLHQPKQALALYKAALEKTPDNVTYAVGIVYCLSDLGRSSEALKFAKEQLDKHPDHPDALVKAYVYVERRVAIDLARTGHYEQALKLLRELRAKYPSDATEEFDYVAVLGWAGHDAEAVKEYKKIERKALPDYVLEAVAHSYRNLHETENALAVYRRGLKQSPRNEVFAAGVVRCLSDLKRYDEGQKVAQDYTNKYGDRLEVLLAGGEAAAFNEDPVVALNFYEHAESISPKNHEALRGMIMAENAMGAAGLALKTADMHRDLIHGDEYRSIVGRSDASLVRWGPLESTSEASRYAETDAAIQTIDAHISEWTAANDRSLYPNIERARFDRIVALRDRERMQDVVNDYNTLVQDGIELPPYVLTAAGEAYLYLRQPEIARDIFLKVLQEEPNDFETRRLLAYAYLECDQYDESFATIDKLQADEPTWVYLKGEPERQPNPNRAMAELEAGELRSYGDLQQESDDRLTPLVQAAPYDARNRAAAGNLYLVRGLPRQALEQFQIGMAIQDGHDVANETGRAIADLDLQNFAEATAEIKDLSARYPENLGVQRAQRDLDIYNMWELDAHAGYNFAPSESSSVTNSPHGQGFDIGAELYSAPINYNWRLFAGEDFAHEHEPNGEGIIDFSRANAGIEYRKSNVTASVAPTFNTYNGSERVGADGKIKYSFNDQWSAGIAAELFSQDTPLRALNAGVTADEYTVSGEWRQNESRQVTFAASVMPFSDNNLRTMQDVEYIERLYTTPNFKLDAEANLALSQDSEDENRLYYNPSSDLQLLGGLRATQTLYHRYETLYEHSLLVMPGLYAQEHYGTSPAWTVRYEQRIHYNDTLNLGAGVGYTHQDYDGSAQDAVSLTMDVVERF